jgi:hypothetical protein
MINVPKKNTTGRRLEPRPAISDELKKLGKAKLYTLKGEEREEMINLRTPLGVGITIPDMFHCYTGTSIKFQNIFLLGMNSG